MNNYDSAALNAGANPLTELENRILEFENHWWKHAGTKEANIKEMFNLTSPDYYQLLNNLIDGEDALAAHPILVKRLRRLRDTRNQSR